RRLGLDHPPDVGSPISATQWRGSTRPVVQRAKRALPLSAACDPASILVAGLRRTLREEIAMIGRFPIYPNLAASDIERAKRWYAEKLDLNPTVDLGNSGLLYMSGGAPFVLYQTESAGTARNTVAAWVVDDLVQLMAELRARGVQFE